MKNEAFRGQQSIEDKESEPKINFNIHYGAHRSWEDLREIEKGLRQADIYFPENAGWSEETGTAYALIAKGEYNPKDLNLEPVLQKELEMLYEMGTSGKILAVSHIDVPEGHPLFSETIELSEEIEEIKDIFEHGYFNDALADMKRLSKEFAQIQKEREEYMRAQIPRKINEILGAYPKLKEKVSRGDVLNVFLSLGALHTRVFHDLKRQGNKVNRSFGEPLLIFSSMLEMDRRNIFDKKVDDELAARSIVEAEISPHIMFMKDSLKGLRILRKICSKLKLGDIEEISTRLGEDEDLIDVLKSFKIEIPRSEEDVDRMLSE